MVKGVVSVILVAYLVKFKFRYYYKRHKSKNLPTFFLV